MRQAAGLIESTMPCSSMVMMPSTAASKIARRRCSFSLKAVSISLYALSLEGIVVGRGAPSRDHSLRAGVPVRPVLLQRKRIHRSTPDAEHSPSIAVSGPNLEQADSRVSKLGVSESQRVGDDGNGTQTHRRSRENGVEQHAEKWIEHACGDGNAERVVNKSKEKVLPDVPHHCTAQHHGLGDGAQVAVDESDAGALHRDIRASA